MTISRCCRPQNSPYFWYDFIDTANKSVVRFNEWLEGLPIASRQDVVGMIQVQEDRATKGRLPKGAPYQIEPVHTYEHMFEMKWEVTEPGTRRVRLIRQYHAEPEAEKKALVRLHRHLKRVDDRETIWAWQQDEIKFAKMRFDAWPGVGSTTLR
ncbi:MAG: hypothetical protein JW722_08025 [Demequinaceae bacterium]|nr:hypothetical protein [Demequinaceae bacterium]